MYVPFESQHGAPQITHLDVDIANRKKLRVRARIGSHDNITLGKLTGKKYLLVDKLEMTMPSKPPKWLTIALAENGVRRKSGEGSCKRIEEYHQSIGRIDLSDKVPWCSSFLNWCIKAAGRHGTNSAAARSWLNWGQALEYPRFGCVVILWRISLGSKFGHVGFFVCESETQVCLFGGNQRGMVCKRWYSKRRILGYRWP